MVAVVHFHLGCIGAFPGSSACPYAEAVQVLLPVEELPQVLKQHSLPDSLQVVEHPYIVIDSF